MDSQKASTPRDTPGPWARFDIVVRTCSAILIPFALWYLSSTTTRGAARNAAAQRMLEDSIAREDREADRVTGLLGFLSSGDERERLLALRLVQDLVRRHQLPIEIEAILAETLASSSSAEERALIEAFPPRVYIHAAADGHRQLADELRRALIDVGFSVPAVKVRGGESPAHTQVRFFHAGDSAKATEIADRLRAIGVEDARASSVGVAWTKKEPTGQLEVWFGRNVSP